MQLNNFIAFYIIKYIIILPFFQHFLKYFFIFIIILVSTIHLISKKNITNNIICFRYDSITNEILMHFRATKKLNNEVYLNEPIGKDKDDNVVTLQEVLENDERSVEESVDLKMKVRLLYEKMKNLLKDRERTILELRFGLDGHKPKTQIEIAEQIGISRSYVSRIETKAIKKLAKEIRD